MDENIRPVGKISLEIDGKTAIITEIDVWGRPITYIYHKGETRRHIPKADLVLKDGRSGVVSNTVFALALLRWLIADKDL
jgi:hypothetical protein